MRHKIVGVVLRHKSLTIQQQCTQLLEKLLTLIHDPTNESYLEDLPELLVALKGKIEINDMSKLNLVFVTKREEEDEEELLMVFLAELLICIRFPSLAAISDQLNDPFLNSLIDGALIVILRKEYEQDLIKLSKSYSVVDFSIFLPELYPPRWQQSTFLSQLQPLIVKRYSGLREKCLRMSLKDREIYFQNPVVQALLEDNIELVCRILVEMILALFVNTFCHSPSTAFIHPLMILKSLQHIKYAHFLSSLAPTFASSYLEMFINQTATDIMEVRSTQLVNQLYQHHLFSTIGLDVD